jgi:hypothetical protein
MPPSDWIIVQDFFSYFVCRWHMHHVRFTVTHTADSTATAFGYEVHLLSSPQIW